ncbi:hypothetical protein DFJ77DRAFT_514434 [Powellomyces hirtus]|nr:hypothetical protein DFJ77DRAFT_514434 [Powellomyces hirtus]
MSQLALALNFPPGMQGLFIGSQQQRVKHLQKATGCTVRLHHSQDGIVQFSGSPNAVKQAHSMTVSRLFARRRSGPSYALVLAAEDGTRFQFESVSGAGKRMGSAMDEVDENEEEHEDAEMVDSSEGSEIRGYAVDEEDGDASRKADDPFAEGLYMLRFIKKDTRATFLPSDTYTSIPLRPSGGRNYSEPPIVKRLSKSHTCDTPEEEAFWNSLLRELSPDGIASSLRYATRLDGLTKVHATKHHDSGDSNIRIVENNLVQSEEVAVEEENIVPILNKFERKVGGLEKEDYYKTTLQGWCRTEPDKWGRWTCQITIPSQSPTCSVTRLPENFNYTAPMPPRRRILYLSPNFGPAQAMQIVLTYPETDRRGRSAPRPMMRETDRALVNHFEQFYTNLWKAGKPGPGPRELWLPCIPARYWNYALNKGQLRAGFFSPFPSPPPTPSGSPRNIGTDKPNKADKPQLLTSFVVHDCELYETRTGHLAVKREYVDCGLQLLMFGQQGGHERLVIPIDLNLETENVNTSRRHEGWNVVAANLNRFVNTVASCFETED